MSQNLMKVKWLACLLEFLIGVSLPGFPGVPVGYMIPSVAYCPVSYGPNGIEGKYPSNKVRNTIFAYISSW